MSIRVPPLNGAVLDVFQGEAVGVRHTDAELAQLDEVLA